MRILFSLLFLVNIIYASVAVVSAFKGKANIYREGKEITIYVGIEINKNDSIKTKNNTKVQLIFKDNTRITIGKNSDFSVEDYFYDEKKASKSKARFRFKKGLFRTISGRIGKLNKKQFKIRVKSATIGIRGTKFDVFINNEFIKIGVIKGAIYFNNNNDITDVKSNYYLIYEYLKDKKTIKHGTLKESKELKKTKNKKKSIINKKKNIKQYNSYETTKLIENEINDIRNINNNLDTFIKKEIIDNGNIVKDIANLDYGYWLDTVNNKRIDTFIDGINTAEDVIQDKIDNQNTARYVGNIASIITDTNGNKVDATGSIILDIDFGYSNISGNIDINNGSYSAELSSENLNTSGFTISNISGNNIDNGTINGSFYGASGNSVGGTISLNGTDKSTVEGTFGAEVE